MMSFNEMEPSTPGSKNKSDHTAPFPSLSLQEPEEILPMLDLWVELFVQGRKTISGVISHHPKHQDGMRILTSAIDEIIQDGAGNSFAKTKNSIYRLGTKIEIKDKSHFFNAASSAKALDSIDKMTIC